MQQPSCPLRNYPDCNSRRSRSPENDRIHLIWLPAQDYIPLLILALLQRSTFSSISKRLYAPCAWWFRTHCNVCCHRFTRLFRDKQGWRWYLAGCIHWPSLGVDIEYLLKSHTKCGAHAKNPTKAELNLWLKPTASCKQVDADFAESMGRNHYVTFVDAYLKWPNRSDELRFQICAHRGLEEDFRAARKSVTDNGVQFKTTSLSD